ncbi:signal peptidase II [Candidatus Woesearchaeota archaeon CG10_big_fil_rev_8_21_14_0_10_45_16]|nr:MAG: signal peptidase II [Candidatus Woesearchaeota archaeon CG10_big_fil_rev_8_21_14_0_10_45_16]
MVKKNLLLFSIISSLVILIDQLTKILILSWKPQWDLKLLTIHLITNTGAGFGILQDQVVWLGIISLIAAAVIIYHYPKISKEKLPQVLFALLLGGIIGNLVDRLGRRFVVDFIDFSFWPAFNIADAAITISALGLIWYYWKK